MYLTLDKNRIPGFLLLWKQLIPSVHCADTLYSCGHTKLVIHPSTTDFEANRFLVLGPYPHKLLFPCLPEASYLTPKCPYILHTSLRTPYLPTYSIPPYTSLCTYTLSIQPYTSNIHPYILYYIKPYKMNGLIYHNTHSVLYFLLEKIVLEVVLRICYAEVLLMLVYYRKI